MDDDNGRTHPIQIPNSIYVPNLQMTLLCPQHWAQQDAISHPWSPDGTVCYTMVEVMVLEWDQQKFWKAFKHSQALITPTFYTSLSIKLYKTLCLQFEAFHVKVAPQRGCFENSRSHGGRLDGWRRGVLTDHG